MKKSTKKAETGQDKRTGGSYREKQPASPPSGKKAGQDSVDENGDGKSDYSVHSGTKKTKTST